MSSFPPSVSLRGCAKMLQSSWGWEQVRALPPYPVSEPTSGGDLFICMAEFSPTSFKRGCPCLCCVLATGSGLCYS